MYHHFSLFDRTNFFLRHFAVPEGNQMALEWIFSRISIFVSNQTVLETIKKVHPPHTYVSEIRISSAL